MLQLSLVFTTVSPSPNLEQAALKSPPRAYAPFESSPYGHFAVGAIVNPILSRDTVVPEDGIADVFGQARQGFRPRSISANLHGSRPKSSASETSRLLTFSSSTSTAVPSRFGANAVGAVNKCVAKAWKSHRLEALQSPRRHQKLLHKSHAVVRKTERTSLLPERACNSARDQE